MSKTDTPKEYYHTHSDRLSALWAWLNNQMYTRVFRPRHSILFQFAAHFLSFCNTNPKIYFLKDTEQFQEMHKLCFEEALVVLNEHLSFHYRTLKDFMKGSEPYVEYIKELRNTKNLQNVYEVKLRRPENCVFSRLESHWNTQSIFSKLR